MMTYYQDEMQNVVRERKTIASNTEWAGCTGGGGGGHGSDAKRRARLNVCRVLLTVFAGRAPSTEQTSDVPVQTAFVYNVTGTATDRRPSRFARTTHRPVIGECDRRLVEFCPFGRVLFIIPNQFPGPVKCSRPPPLPPVRSLLSGRQTLPLPYPFRFRAGVMTDPHVHWMPTASRPTDVQGVSVKSDLMCKTKSRNGKARNCGESHC